MFAADLLGGGNRPHRPPSTAPGDRTNNWVDEGVREFLRPRRQDVRRVPSLRDDPFCTDESFFASGRYRKTAYINRYGVGDDRNAPANYSGHGARRGAYTGAARCEGPKVFRKFGNNTRQSVMPYRRYNHMHVTGFDDDVVGSKSVPSLLNPNAALGQSGAPEVLAKAGLTTRLGAGRPGSRHPLLDG